MAMMMLKALALWLLILVLAIANGLLREAWLIPWLGPVPGLVASGLLLCCAIVLAAYAAAPWLRLGGARQALSVGLGWLALTLAFEFGFGLARGRPMTEILAAFAFEGGNLWPLILLVTALAPWLAARLRGWP